MSRLVNLLCLHFSLNNCTLYLAPHTSPPRTSDFPGGEGESRFLNRGGQEHIQGETGLRALGFKKFDIPEGASVGETQAVLEANRILFSEV